MGELDLLFREFRRGASPRIPDVLLQPPQVVNWQTTAGLSAERRERIIQVAIDRGFVAHEGRVTMGITALRLTPPGYEELVRRFPEVLRQ